MHRPILVTGNLGRYDAGMSVRAESNCQEFFGNTFMRLAKRHDRTDKANHRRAKPRGSLGMLGLGLVFAIIILAARPCALHAEDSSIIAPGANVEKLADGFEFTEGPAVDKQGNVYFTDQPNDRILKWGTDGKLSTFLQPAGRSNGLCFDAQGNLWACADEKNELWRIDPATGKHTVVVKDYQGKLLNGPNDVWVRRTAACTSPIRYYQRPYWKRGPMEQDQQAVYFLSPDGKQLTRVAADLKQPNGMIGTPDGKTLYVADIGDGKTFAYDIQPDGSLTNKRLFCELGSDGMTIDDGGQCVFDRQGRDGVRQGRQEDRADQRARRLDGQCLLWRRRHADVVHHGRQRAVLAEDESQRRQQPIVER